MTTAETYDEITRTLGEDLKWMSQKAEAKWPTLEPEMLLLNWLCYRNGIDPPPHPILKRPLKSPPSSRGTGVKTSWAEELQLRPLLPEVTVATGRPAPTAPRVPVMSPVPAPLARGSRPPSASRQGSTRPGSAARSVRVVSPDATWPPHGVKTRDAPTPSTMCASTFSSPEPRLQEPFAQSQSPFSTGALARTDDKTPEPQTPTWGRNFMDALSAAEAKLPDSYAAGPQQSKAPSIVDGLGSPLSSTSLQPVDFGMKTLTGLLHKIDTDVERHLGRSDHIVSRNCALSDAAMERRHDLRHNFLDRCPLFSLDVISREEQNALKRSLRIQTFSRHECLLSEGEISHRLIIIERGECDVVRGGDVVGQPVSGSFFGEASLVFNVPSKVGVVAASEVRALWLNREDVAAVVKGSGLWRMRTAARARLCADVPLLAGLTPSQQVRIAEKMRSERWRRGSTLVGPMHASARLFIVEEGECKVIEKDHRGLATCSKHSMEASQHLRDSLLRPGQFFGMEGLLFSSEMGCHVVAHSEVKSLSISYEDILESCDPDERKEVATQMHSAMQVFLLRQVPQLRNLPNESFNTVRAQVEEVLFKPWTAVIPRGAVLDTVYVLKNGKVVEHEGDAAGLKDFSKIAVQRPESVTPGDCFWSRGLVDGNAKAKTTVVALTHTSMLKVQRKTVSSILHETCEKLEQIPLFTIAALSKQDLLSLACELHAWHFAPHRTIIVEGELGERLFIVESGVCDIVKVVNGREKVVGQLGRGACFGELSVFFDEPRKITVRSVTEVTVLTLRREHLGRALPQAKLARVHSAALSLCLKSIPLLSRLDVDLRQFVAQRFQTQTWKAGDVIQRRLLPCQSLFFIERGTCLATTGDASQSSRLVHLLGESELPAFSRQEEETMLVLGPGQYFGMRGFLTGASLGFAVAAESAEVRTSSISYEELISAAGSDRQEELQRQLREALRIHFLRQLPPLEELEEDEILAVVITHCQELTYQQGEVIIPKGAPVDGFLLLETGKVIQHTVSPEEVRGMWWEGTEFSSPGACFPPGSCYREISGGAHVSTFTLMAESSCNLLRVPLEALTVLPGKP